MQRILQKKPERLHYIDFLKAVGLTGIIIAHVGPPAWAMMLRNFDVPLMVILSSILAERSYRKYNDGGVLSAGKYCLTRIKRLVIPTWIFLTLYFMITRLIDGHFQSIQFYIDSYCLTKYGMGYVWVILIYLYSAILIPIFCKWRVSKRNAAVVVVIYLLYEMAYHFKIGVSNKVLDTTFYYIVPYGLLTYFGANYKQLSMKARCRIIAGAFIVFAMFGCYYWLTSGTPQNVQIAKYPPRLYYLSYGVLWSFSLLLLCEKHQLKIYTSPFIRYISAHSLWIYLWHILAIYVYGILHLPEIWYLKFIIVYLMALVAVFMVNKLLDLIGRDEEDY